MMMEGVGPDLINSITREFDNVMQGAQLRGFNVNDPTFLSSLTSTLTNPLFDPSKFNADDFLSIFAPAQSGTAEIASNSALTSENFALISEKTPIIASDLGTAEGSLGAMVTHTDKIATTLDALSGKKISIPVELDWVNLGGLVALILPGLVQAVQSAGGVMPGTDARASTSGPMVRQGQGAF
jgi:hypothetical protein